MRVCMFIMNMAKYQNKYQNTGVNAQIKLY